MPYRRLPNSMPAVIRTLKTARDTYNNTPMPADRAISAEQFAQLDTASSPGCLLARVLKEARDVDIAQATGAPFTTELSKAAARLTMLVSHFHQVLDLGIIRGTFPRGTRSYFGRDLEASAIPDLSTYELVKEAGEKIVSGETDRQSEDHGNYVAMALPSAAEVGQALTEFLGYYAPNQQAKVRADRESEELMALYPEAQALAVDICDTVEFFYRKDPDASSRRVKCQRWGVVYVYDEGETPDPAPEPVPAPTPTP